MPKTVINGGKFLVENSRASFNKVVPELTTTTTTTVAPGGLADTIVYDNDPIANGEVDRITGDPHTIPSNWKAFNSDIDELQIGNTCTSIGGYAFESCTNLTGPLTIPNSVTNIGGYAFRRCSGFTGSLVIPDSVTSIGSVAFNNCSGFNGTLTIGNSVTTIGIFAFAGCTGLTGSLILGNSVTSIQGNAFRNCSGLNSLTIPNSVTSIGSLAFYGCSSMTTVNCYVTKDIIDTGGSPLHSSSGVTTIHARSTDGTWSAGGGQTIGGKSGITVIKDL